MYRMLMALVAAGSALAAPATATGAGLFSARGPVIAILADELFLGEAEGNLGGAGTLAIRARKDDGSSCLGQFTSSAELGGEGTLRCSDGTTATYSFQRLSVFSGHGSGTTSRGPMSFTYGLTAEESAPFLKLPPGGRLVQNGGALDLVAIARPAPAGAPARDAAPDVLLRAVTADVIAILRKDEDIRDGNPAKLAELVETRILAHFDFARMTQLAMGRNWRLATPDQQRALTSEFRTLLVRTYSVALSGYRDQQIEYRPIRTTPEATEVTVRSEVRQAGRQAIAIDYEMEKMPAGWKVYDIKITGVSLVTTYRDTFAGRVRDGGIDGLLKSLTDRNRQYALKRAQGAP